MRHFIIKTLVLIIYIIPGWKVIDLMWEVPLHLNGVVLKGRVQSGDVNRQFIITVDIKGGAKYLSLEEREVFPVHLAEQAFKILFTTLTKSDLTQGLTNLGVDLEKVDLGRINGSVCYVLGELQKPRLWVDKEKLVPMKMENGDTEVLFQEYTDFSRVFFPKNIEVRRGESFRHTIFIDEISFIKTTK